MKLPGSVLRRGQRRRRINGRLLPLRERATRAGAKLRAKLGAMYG